ncbi:MAG TPA: hypothetical protein PL131_11180 [Methylotenera sp.]|nr:hypothetical protein [Methylotenera sp.]HPH06429.1 hypothetical protein [Methylotenera sp.]HPN00424.1 hypothetical protein [Methylotenera sp.]
MSFNALNPPPTVNYQHQLEGEALAAYTQTVKAALPHYLQDRQLQFKSCWVSWLGLVVCLAFALWFAVFYWQSREILWLVLGLVFIVLVFALMVEILVKSKILTIYWLSLRRLNPFVRNEYDNPLFHLRHSVAHLYKAPPVLCFEMSALYLKITQADKKCGEITFTLPWAKVRQVKPCLYFGQPAVGFSYYQPLAEVAPAEASAQVQAQLYKTRVDELGDGLAQVVISTAPFALNPVEFAKLADSYAMFSSEYYPGYC